jgi:hypothetical protein
MARVYYEDREAVRRVRQRFNEAIAAGYSTEAATDYANGKGPLEPPLAFQRGPDPFDPEKVVKEFEDTDQRAGGDDDDGREGLSEDDQVDADAKARQAAEAGDGGGKPSEPQPEKHPFDDVEIPEDWRKLPWPTRLKLGASVSDTPIANGDDVERAIEAELRRRAAKAEAGSGAE